ncbi:MAG: FapA family protein [Spirochaetia bacterium]
MVNLEKIRSYMRKQAEDDRKNRSVQVTGETLEEALSQAAMELGLKVSKLEYEVLQKGSKGMLGMGKKDWILIAYEAMKTEEVASFDEDMGVEDIVGTEDVIAKDKDGEIFVRLTSDGAFLKVTPPKGKGKKAKEKTAMARLQERALSKIDENMVKQVVKNADGAYVKVGEFIYNPTNDPIVNVEITDNEMKAYMTVTPPGPGGTDLSYENIVTFLKSNGVVHGYEEETMQAFEDRPVYKEPVLVAVGNKAIDGKDARIIYNFETDTSKVKLKEKDGKVDFKELNLVQNVVEGQILAKKLPAEKGEPGRTVTGKLLPAKAGKDIEIGIGKNVKLSEDKMKAISTINGQVVLTNYKINVEPVYVVPGDVNLHTGNILFLGTVVVKGSVEDGFSVKAAGNIEVKGNVGKCELDSEGDVIVHQGILGKSGGKVKCGRSVWAKFIENAHIEAGEFVVVSDGIINSDVDSNKKIVCQGKRARIVGGHLRASEEIHAKILGSPGGAETLLEVGYDPRKKERLVEIEAKKSDLQSELDDVELNMHTLENMLKMKKKLPEDKQKNYQQLRGKKYELTTEIKKIDEEIDEIQRYLASLKVKGKVSAASKVYPGVRVTVKDISMDVKSDYKAVTFVNENNIIQTAKYEELEEDFSRRE